MALWPPPSLTSYPASMCSSCEQTFASALPLHIAQGMVFRGADEFQGNRSTSSEEFHKLYCFPNMIVVMRFRWTGWARNVECVRDMRYVKEIKYVNTGTNEKIILKHILIQQGTNCADVAPVILAVNLDFHKQPGFISFPVAELLQVS